MHYSRVNHDLPVYYAQGRVVDFLGYGDVKLQIVTGERCLCQLKFRHQFASRLEFLLSDFLKILISELLPQPHLEVAIYKDGPAFVTFRSVSKVTSTSQLEERGTDVNFPVPTAASVILNVGLMESTRYEMRSCRREIP